MPLFAVSLKKSVSCGILQGEFINLNVWKLDRFARNRYDSAYYKNILKKNGVKVISAKENISDGPEGVLLESMLEGWAEYYSVDLSEKIGRGLTENALKGKMNGGGAGGLVGAGVGLGIGADLARSMGETVNGATQSKCPVCGAAMPSSARFCPECGTSVKRACPKCSAPLSPGAKFCPECGAKV